ncbi:hypothetical protein EPN87_03245 [archaeon]|nr:MAG: hypothetical protein EPN87_03245 [archaeon]
MSQFFTTDINYLFARQLYFCMYPTRVCPKCKNLMEDKEMPPAVFSCRKCGYSELE